MNLLSSGPALLDPNSAKLIARPRGAAVRHPYEEATARVSMRQKPQNLVFLEATVLLPVGVKP
jgi:hypothetical protein